MKFIETWWNFINDKHLETNWKAMKFAWNWMTNIWKPNEIQWNVYDFWICLDSPSNLPHLKGHTFPKPSSITGWWFQTFFIFTPTWGNDPIWLINIFQMGWNHHLDKMLVLQILSFFSHRTKIGWNSVQGFTCSSGWLEPTLVLYNRYPN